MDHEWCATQCSFTNKTKNQTCSVHEEITSAVIPFWKCPHEHAQRCVSWVILTSIMLTMKIRQHIGPLDCHIQLSRNYTRAEVQA